MTSSSNPRLTSLEIDSIPPFQDTVEFEFDPEVNLFIGVNGTGKSTILKVLAISFPGSAISGYAVEKRSITVASWPRGEDRRPDVDAVPQIYFHPIRVVMPSLPTVKDDRPTVKDDRPTVKDDRIYQLPGPDSWDDLKGLLDESRQSYLSYFDGRRVYQFIRLVHQFIQSLSIRYRKDLSGPLEVTRTAFRCVKDISREVVRGDSLLTITTSERVGDRRQESSDIPEELLSTPVERYDVGILTAQTGQEPLYLGELSTGTQGVFLWIWYLAYELAHFYNFSEGWSSKPGIAFIDEIENHLHPTWQRRVIPALRKHFPNVQIFATTHSPFVVAGLKRGQVHHLYREGGVIKTTKLTDEEKEQRIVGWTVEDILSEFMEVDDPTDPETAEAAATLRWLRYQMPSEGSAEAWKAEKIAQLEGSAESTRDEKEALHWLQNQGALQGSAIEWWEESISLLRSMVSRDLEEGGPIAAQRALFLEQLSKLLSEDESQGEDDSDDSKEG